VVVFFDVKWLKRRVDAWNPERALRWMYRKGFRRGKLKGIEIGKREAATINQCQQHHVPLFQQTLQLANGTLAELWTCPYWQEHTTAPTLPAVERHTDRIPYQVIPQRPMATFIQARNAGMGIHTAMEHAIPRQGPKTRKLTPGEGHR
jgi:hypothetical protein